MDLARKEHSGQEQVLVVFGLAGEEYAAPIFQVREVIKLPAIVKVPQSDDFMEGIINIRGRVIPVVNLKKRLLLGSSRNEQARVMIVELAAHSAGLIVDQVSEVIRVGIHDIQPAPRLASKVDNRYIKGVAYINGRMVMLLDLEQVFSNSERHGLLAPAGS